MTSPKTVTPDQPQAVPDMVLVPHVKDAWDENAEQIAHNLADQFGPDFVLANQAFAKAAVEEYLYAAALAACPVLPVETPAAGLRDPYYGALNDCLVRYRGMAAWAGRRDLIEFIKEFAEHIDNAAPLMKLNRWLGYIQGQLIAAGLTTVEAERNWTRPLFRPLDFPATTPAPLSGRDGSLREALENLGKFGWHPDPAIDFEVEIEKLESRFDCAKNGTSKPGEQPEMIAAVVEDIRRAMTFKAGGTVEGVVAKNRLRELESAALAAVPSETAEMEGAAIDPRIAPLCRGYELMHRVLCNIAGTSGADAHWYVGKAYEVTRRLSRVAEITADSNAAAPGDCLQGAAVILDELKANAAADRLAARASSSGEAGDE